MKTAVCIAVTLVALAAIGQTFASPVSRTGGSMSSAHQSSEPYDLRGLKLGTDLDAFREFPPPTDGYWSDARAVCSGDDDRESPEVYGTDVKIGLIECQWRAHLNNGVGETPLTVNMGDSSAGSPEFLFIPASDGKSRLMEISVETNIGGWEDEITALSHKFGKPKTLRLTAEKRDGTKVEGLAAVWKNGVSTITVQQRCGEVELVCTTYRKSDLENIYHQKKNQIDGPPNSKI